MDIRFRFWDHDEERYDYFTLQTVKMYWDILNRHLLNGSKPEQYIGLKDVNDIDIFVGSYHIENEDSLMLIAFNEGSFGYNIYDLNNDGSWSFIEFAEMSTHYYNAMDFSKNINEHPEVLK